MKRILSVIIMCALFVCASAQTKSGKTYSTTKFLHRYSALVERIQDEYAENADSIAAWKAEHKAINQLYKSRYHDVFTDDELEQYFKIAAKYKNKMLQYKINDLGTQADSLGHKIGKKMSRFGKKVSGVIGGLKEQSEENRSK